MIGSVLVHVAGSRLAFTRLDLNGRGLESPTGKYSLLELPSSPSVVGERARTMLSLPETRVPDDEQLRRFYYRQVAELLNLGDVDLLDVSPHLFVSVLRSGVKVSFVSRRTPRSKMGSTLVATLPLDVSDDDLGGVILAHLADD
jgi:hypothetical protein